MDRSVSRKRWAVPCSCLGVLLLVGLLCLLPIVLTSRNRLSVIGRRVADASTWTRTYSGYYWDTNETQIVISGRSFKQTLRLIDRTSQTIPVPLESMGRDLWTQVPQGVRPSPDGKWQLFEHTGFPYCAAVEMSTHRVVKWKAAARSMTYVLWFPDSRRWVEFDQTPDGRGAQPIIHSLDGPDRRMTPITDTFIWPIGTVPASHVLNARNQEHLELWEYDIEGDVKTPKRHPIGLPTSASVYEVEGSPDGTRVAYLVQENTRSYVARLLERILPARRDPSKNLMSVWVSRTDGSALHRIGFERASEAAGLQWSPDGKRLSLFLDEGFYVVPAD
ncbi:MAG: hypothetical protein JWL77_6655 [Chthonomonadaceae bacterium]|nr:hypothetical protein [Chthonomonadaceae bacterium]